MGYRSQVAYVIKFQTLSDRDSFVTLMLARNDPVLTEAINETLHKSATDPVICFEDGDTKWYDDYPGVKAHHGLMSEAAELYDAGYRFCRVGEETDDLVEDHHDPDAWECWLYDYCAINREVACSFPVQVDDDEKTDGQT